MDDSALEEKVTFNMLELSFYGVCFIKSSCEFRWMWIFPWIKLPTILPYVRQTNLDDLIDSGNFCEGLSFLNKKDSITHVHSFVVYVKEGLPFTREASLENFVDSYLCFQLALLHSVSYFFYSVDHFLRHCARFLTLFHLTYMRLSHQPICY